MNIFSIMSASNSNPNPSSLKRSRESVQKFYKSTLSSSTTTAGKRELLQQCSKSSIASANASANKLFIPIGVASIPIQIAVGIASASYWRGMWYILDDNLFPNDPIASAVTCLVGGTLGLATVQGVVARKAEYYASKDIQKLPSSYTKIARFGTLYCVATSCILVWRGTWIACDVVYEKMTNHSALEPGHMTTSGIWTHVLATAGLLAVGRFSSVLGPPSRISILKDTAFQATTWHQYSKAAKWFFK
jgi:hypothetical protein